MCQKKEAKPELLTVLVKYIYTGVFLLTVAFYELFLHSPRGRKVSEKINIVANSRLVNSVLEFPCIWHGLGQGNSITNSTARHRPHFV